MSAHLRIPDLTSQVGRKDQCRKKPGEQKSPHAQEQSRRASAGLPMVELVWASQTGAVKTAPGLSHLYTARNKRLKEHKRARERWLQCSLTKRNPTLWKEDDPKRPAVYQL